MEWSSNGGGYCETMSQLTHCLFKPGGGGGGGGGGPRGGPKAKAKAKAKGKARAAPAETAAPAQTPEQDAEKKKKVWTKKDLAKVCFYHQSGSCWYGGQCSKDHVMVPTKHREEIPKPASRSPGPGKGKGKGKGGGKGGGKGRDPSRPRGVKMFCKDFLESGKCDDANCKGPFLDAEAVKKLHDAHPGKINANGYMNFGGDKGKSKGKGKK